MTFRHPGVALLALLVGCATPAALPPAPAPLEEKLLTVDEMNRLGPDTGIPQRLDLAPARWIWFPSARTLPNTFVLFRREVTIETVPVRALGWITADSRYRLTVDGQFVQWGPAPSDPRALDVDPVDLTAYLKPGRHVIGIEVLYYGRGDGTWVTGKPGLLFHLVCEDAGGRSERILSDERWQAFLDRAHAPGHYPRWYLRALQEEFDARLHPDGWDTPAFQPDERWLAAMLQRGRADQSSLALGYPDALEDQMASKDTQLRARQIPLLRRVETRPKRLADSARVRWCRDPRDWFESRVPGSFEISRGPVAVEIEPGVWELPATGEAGSAVLATFEFPEEIVGWPHFTIDAPAGTVVELMVQESHDPQQSAWLDTHFFAWSRFICRDGPQRFETFDYEALRWLQVHVRNASRPVRIREVGVQRRLFRWRSEPNVRSGEPALQTLFDACLNTLSNSVQDHVVDGMGRERQQYPGDAGHQNAAVRYAFGETRASRRFLRTFSEGITLEGYFMDTWPSTDRMRRIAQRQIGAVRYGPMIDEGIGFVFDCWSYCLDTGDLDGVHEPYPRLLRFAETLERWRKPDGLLPVEDFGTPSVWMDRNDCYPRQKYKQCAYNLYAAAMFRHALAPLARAFGDAEQASRAERISREILDATIRVFWSEERGLFVNNLPWIAEEKTPRLCDRSLATAILFDQCPGGRTAAALQALVDRPPELGIAFPANTLWRHRALIRMGRADIAVREYRERWATLPSVLQNNTLQETWVVRSDSTDQWSHCGVVPLLLLFTDLLGLRPLEPGFSRYELQPRLGDLGRLHATAHTPLGPFEFTVEPVDEGHRLELTVPASGAGRILLPSGAQPLKAGRNVVLIPRESTR
ncbi:MAG TPA: alpha-L-rhamnosidase N-terminal domain-containing protein [Planctomycetota bacterium]|nr:alpha-L-rhamnosidase N-terminal domain-containing protein [Planctomycetota bacterium]